MHPYCPTQTTWPSNTLHAWKHTHRLIIILPFSQIMEGIESLLLEPFLFDMFVFSYAMSHHLSCQSLQTLTQKNNIYCKQLMEYFCTFSNFFKCNFYIPLYSVQSSVLGIFKNLSCFTWNLLIVTCITGSYSLATSKILCVFSHNFTSSFTFCTQ